MSAAQLGSKHTDGVLKKFIYKLLIQQLRIIVYSFASTREVEGILKLMSIFSEMHTLACVVWIDRNTHVLSVTSMLQVTNVLQL